MTDKDKRPSHPIDGGWGWMVVLGCTLSIFIMGGILRTFGITLDIIQKHFEVQMSMAVLILTVEGVFYTLAASVGVMIAERYTARVVVMTAGVIGGLGISLSSLTLNIPYMIGTMGVGIGIANGLLHGNGLVMVSKYFEKRRALATGLAVAGGSIGQFVMPPVIQYLINTYLLSGTLLIMGAMYLHLLVSGSLYRPISFYERRTRHGQEPPVEGRLLSSNYSIGEHDKDALTHVHSEIECEKGTNDLKTREIGYGVEDKEVDIEVTEKLMDKRLQMLKVPGWNDNKHTLSAYTSMEDIVSASLASLSHTDKIDVVSIPESTKKTGCCGRTVQVLKTLFDLSLLKRPTFLYYVVTHLFIFVGIFNVLFFIPSHADKRGFSEFERAFLISVNGICDLLGRIGCGFFADLNLMKRFKILFCVAALSSVNCVCLPFATVYWWLCIHCGIYGFTNGAYLPLLPTVTVDFFGLDLLPKALAVLLFSTGGGAAGLQPLLALLADLTGTYDIVFFVSGGMCLIGGIMCLCLPLVIKPRQENPDSQRDDKVTPLGIGSDLEA